ncbi:hypothetical protein QYF61_012050 [Mycteria americana]|uniref:Uncharacterized protein n=1 Tax=Mycteria americana TaxID=33587 RepID=A0AAN7NAA2_MYCAM|nr:hypothetical protein QYF61_012050 [Mycteria americana]
MSEQLVPWVFGWMGGTGFLPGVQSLRLTPFPVPLSTSPARVLLLPLWLAMETHHCQGHCSVMITIIRATITEVKVGDGISKNKTNLELNLLSDVRDDNKGFYRYIMSRRKTRKKVGLLLRGAGDMVTKDMEET